jgi:hypothetical protein
MLKYFMPNLLRCIVKDRLQKKNSKKFLKNFKKNFKKKFQKKISNFFFKKSTTKHYA